MKKLLLGALLLLSTLSFSQNDTIEIIHTNRMYGDAIIQGEGIKVDYEFILTDNSLTMRLTNEKNIKEYQKYSTQDLSKAIKLVDFQTQNVKLVSKVEGVYIYQGNDIRITIVKNNNMQSLLYEAKDSFTGQISKIIYISNIKK